MTEMRVAPSGCFASAMQAVMHARDVLMRDNQVLGEEPMRAEELRRLDRAMLVLTDPTFDAVSNKRGDDRRHYICVCPDCVKTKEKAEPLDFQRVQKIVAEAHIDYCLNKFDSFEVALIRQTEKAHDIT